FRGFFFQAEDGIRDLIVTGVQTCALPISHAAHGFAILIDWRPRASNASRSGWRSRGRRALRRAAAPGRRDKADAPARCARAPRRSEERRVGKERRSLRA